MYTIRPALQKDEVLLFDLASMLPSRFVIERSIFGASFVQLIKEEEVYVRVIETADEIIGYLLGWSRLAFYSNGRWVGCRKSWYGLSIAAAASASC